MADLSRKGRLASVSRLLRKQQEQDQSSFEIELLNHASALKSRWANEAGADGEWSLRDSHALLSVELIARLIHDEARGISRSWQRSFPLRDGEWNFVFPDVQIEAARSGVVDELKAGRLVATGLDTREPLKPRRMRIPAESFAAFDVVDFERSELRAGTVTIRDVRVSAISPAVTAQKRPRCSEKALRNWIKARVARWDAGTPAPSERDDIAAAEGDLPCFISRDKFRELRRENAPEEWLRKGRRRSVSSRNQAVRSETRGTYSRK